MDSKDLEYVGFWPRFGACLIDVLLQLVVTLPLTYAVYGRISDPSRVYMGFWDVVFNLIVPAVFVIAFWVKVGATPGKLAMSARVVDAHTGERLTTKQAVVRYLGYVVSLLPFFVGYLWIAFDRKKQGWHDKLANTVVVRPAGKEPVAFARQWTDRADRADPEYRHSSQDT